MGVLAKNKNQITLFFNSENSIGKQIEAYVTSSEKEVLTIDTSKTKVTETQWTEIAEGLGLPLSNLIAREHPDFKQEYGETTKDMEPMGWLKILKNNPHLLKYPIMINGKTYALLKSATAFKEHIAPDSAGIEKK